MKLLVQVGARAEPDGTPERFDIQLVEALVSQVELTVLGSAQATAAYRELASVDVLTELTEDLASRFDMAVQTHPFLPKINGLPTTVIVTDLSIHDIGWAYEPARAELTRRFHKNLLRADAVLCIGDHIAEHLAVLEPLARTKTSSVAFPSPPELDHEISVLVEAQRTIDARPILVSLCSLRPERNDWNLLAALQLLGHRGVDVELVLCGPRTNTWNASVRRQVDRLGLGDRTTLLQPGDRLEMTTLIDSSSVIVAASMLTMHDTSIDAALLRRRPLVCADTPARRTQLERLGVDVPVFDPHDPDHIADSIERALSTGHQIVESYPEARHRLQRRSWQHLANTLLSRHRP